MITETIQQIQDYAQQNLLQDEVKIIPDDFPIGQYIPQGDINIIRLGRLPEGCIEAASDPQLAPGTTRGSRHCIRLADMANVRFYRLLNPNPLQGPVLEFLAPVVIEHPEHKHQQWPAGIVAITYQRRHADEIRRVQD